MDATDVVELYEKSAEEDESRARINHHVAKLAAAGYTDDEYQAHWV